MKKSLLALTLVLSLTATACSNSIDTGNGNTTNNTDDSTPEDTSLFGLYSNLEIDGWAISDADSVIRDEEDDTLAVIMTPTDEEPQYSALSFELEPCKAKCDVYLADQTAFDDFVFQDGRTEETGLQAVEGTQVYFTFENTVFNEEPQADFIGFYKHDDYFVRVRLNEGFEVEGGTPEYQAMREDFFDYLEEAIKYTK